MREKKWTPGPWNFHDGWKFYRQNFTYFMLELGKNAGSRLTKYTDQWKANAMLAEAAPDLVEALENCEGFLDNPVMRRRHGDDKFYIEMISDLQAALAKAYGETP